MPLITIDIASSKEPKIAFPPKIKDGTNKDTTYGIKGANMPNPAMAQTTRFINDHS